MGTKRKSISRVKPIRYDAHVLFDEGTWSQLTQIGQNMGLAPAVLIRVLVREALAMRLILKAAHGREEGFNKPAMGDGAINAGKKAFEYAHSEQGKQHAAEHPDGVERRAAAVLSMRGNGNEALRKAAQDDVISRISKLIRAYAVEGGEADRREYPADTCEELLVRLGALKAALARPAAPAPVQPEPDVASRDIVEIVREVWDGAQETGATIDAQAYAEEIFAVARKGWVPREEVEKALADPDEGEIKEIWESRKNLKHGNLCDYGAISPVIEAWLSKRRAHPSQDTLCDPTLEASPAQEPTPQERIAEKLEQWLERPSTLTPAGMAAEIIAELVQASAAGIEDADETV